MTSADEVYAIGRLGDPATPWFGIARVGADASPGGGYALIFGEADGSLRSLAPIPAAGGDESLGDPEAERGVLIALIAFFEGEARDPPPELEMTQWEAAEAVRWLAGRRSGDERWAGSLAAAVDAVDDGLPADVVTGHLYRALAADDHDDETRAASLAELRGIYERLGR